MEKKYSVLIVDDIEEHRLLLRRMVESMGHNIEEAENGKEALEIVRSNKPDLIISDVLMPVMDGFKFCQEIKSDNELSDIPFVFYTGTYTDEQDKKFGLNLGADKYITKPQELIFFKKLLENLFGEYRNGTFVASKKVCEKEEDIPSLYSERLIKKLEHTVLKLGDEIIKRKNSEKELSILNDELNIKVAEKTKKLKERADDLERFFKATVDRELRMKELCDENEKLKAEMKKKG